MRHDFDPYWWDNSNAVTDEERRAWNLTDALAQIDHAERSLEKGCNQFERCIHLASLAGRTPDQARADARALYGEAA